MPTLYSRAYLLTKVLTANNREVILYLYEGALGYADRAIEARKEGNESGCGDALDKIVSILIELSSSLDFNQNGALALRLSSIYNYLIEALTLSTKEREIEPIETCKGVLTILSDAWRQALAAEKQNAMLEVRPQLRASA